MSVTANSRLNQPAPASQNDLIRRAQTGSTDAFEQLVRRYQMEVRWFLCRKIGDVNAVDDLAQEVFLAAMTQIAKLNDHASLRSWLLAIAHNKSVDYLRTISRRRIDHAIRVEDILHREPHTFANDLGANDLGANDPGDKDVDQSQLMSALSDCIRNVKPYGQSILRAFYFDNQTAEQIAADHNKKSSAVRMALLRIRKGLAKCIQQKLHFQGDSHAIE